MILRGELLVSISVLAPPIVKKKQAASTALPGPGIGRPMGRGYLYILLADNVCFSFILIPFVTHIMKNT